MACCRMRWESTAKTNRASPIYNFQYIDALYDAILNIGMKPFVELSFMPQALASGSKTVFWWKGNITPPKDYGKWEQLIQALVQHWTSRYGADEVKQWYFEVWNEPNLDIFWSGNQAEYFKLYEVTARAIKKCRLIIASVDQQRRATGGYRRPLTLPLRTASRSISLPRTTTE